ncbi:HU family DNA-binding protein [Clostridium tagluense]|uniref:Transcriptional regulator n=1 Tax=Clostridium tagluense TaxID=360422 RepID=A0A401ULK4_9CLOT|nr:HU family DNA-binding protein [Clostridium tagluense]GCD10416.1 transcriptional regulator [Clostridium tagluense]
MNKTELINKSQEKLQGFTKAELAMALDTITDTIQDALVAGEKVKLSGFGTFETRARKGRKGVSKLPKAMGKEWASVDRTVPVFNVSEGFKTRVIEANKLVAEVNPTV